MKILLTSFEPFGGRTTNASFEAMSLVPDKFGDIQTDKKLLPVDYLKATSGIRSLILSGDYDYAVCLGLAAGRKTITPERVAINVMDGKTPDNSGFAPSDQAISENGPAAYFSTLPIKAMVKAMTEAGMPAAVSDSAGTYVCNAVMYSAIEAAEKTHRTKAGFVHLPGEEVIAPDKAAEAILACFLTFKG